MFPHNEKSRSTATSTTCKKNRQVSYANVARAKNLIREYKIVLVELPYQGCNLSLIIFLTNFTPLVRLEKIQI